MELWAKYSVLFILVSFSLVDFFYNKDILLWSGNISYYFQEHGGKTVYILAQILSSIFTFWMPVVVVIYSHLSNNSRDSLYHFVKYFLAVAIGVFFKMLMYQGRPYLACEKIKGCTCDPGMPSGHAIMAVSGYYAVYVIFTERLPEFSPAKYSLRVAGFKLVSIILALAVIWSRIALGAHSVDQLFIGTMISVNVILWFDKPTFDKIYDYLEHHSVSFSLIFALLCLASSIFFLYLNHEFREDNQFLKYWDKCPKCKNTMVVSQSLNAALMQIVPGALLYYPYDHKKKLHPHHENYKAYEKVNHRFGVFFFLVLIIPGILFLIGEGIQRYLLTSVYSSSLFLLFYLSPVAFYVGMAMSYFNELIFSKFGLDTLLKPIIEDEYEDEVPTSHRTTFSREGDLKLDIKLESTKELESPLGP